jgi:predicted RNA-binding Zn-ribbon protein involved in translation (DUF1610 family)
VAERFRLPPEREAARSHFMGDRCMALIVINCPKTGRKVSTQMAADQRAWDALPPAWTGAPFRCPHCGGIHAWTKKDARIAGRITLTRPGSASELTSD